MNEKDLLQQGLNQIAWILNYQPTIAQQTIIVGERPETGSAATADVEAERETAPNRGERKVTRERFRSALIKLFASKNMKGKPLFTGSSDWVAVFRVAVDVELVADSAYEDFVKMIEEMRFPVLPKPLSKTNVSNAYSGVYTKPVEQWTEEAYLNSRTTDGARLTYFYSKLAIALKLQELLR